MFLEAREKSSLSTQFDYSHSRDQRSVRDLHITCGM